MQGTSKTRVLVELIVKSYAGAGCTPAQLLQGPINITDLTWQAPPLQTDCTLGGEPLGIFLDSPVAVELAALQQFYMEGLFHLRNHPDEVSSRQGFKRLSKMLPRSPAGERNLIFPLPEAWPVGTPTTGQSFALDAAWLCKTSVAEVSRFVSDASNYYAVTPAGVIGVVDGRPSMYPETWDVDCSGMVQSMLAMPRGLADAECHYDLVDRLRSVLHAEPERFLEFEGTDWALQALRILADGETCKPLLVAVQGMTVQVFQRKAKVTAFDECIQVMEDWQYTDRTKIAMLLDILVPTHLTIGQFCSKILDVQRNLPAVLSSKKEGRIMYMLRKMQGKADHDAG